MQEKDNDLLNGENSENRKNKNKKEKNIGKKNDFSKTFISSVSDFTHSIPKIEVESGKDYRKKKEQSMTEREKRRYKKKKTKTKQNYYLYYILYISSICIWNIYRMEYISGNKYF